MNLVFLDIDGVLNHDLFYKEKSQSERYKEVGLPLCDLDPTRIELLNTLLRNTKSKAVISSTWRKGRDKETLQSLLEKVGFTGEILDVTPVIFIDGMTTPRGVEIHKWHQDNKDIIGNDKYIILDDDSDMLYWQRNNLFLVDGYCGLTPNLIYKAERFLNGTDNC